MNSNIDVLTAFLMGLAGAGHCLAMCGGIASAIGVKRHWAQVIWYNAGRMLSYIVLGALVGAAVGFVVPDSAHSLMVLRWIAVAFLLALGLYFTGWWPFLVHLEKAAKPLWQQVKKLSPQRQQGGWSSLLAGMVWGWLPCGLVYSALSYAALTGNAVGGGLIMAAFAIGTFPAMVGAGYFSQAIRSVLQARGFKMAMGIMLILYALWTAMVLIRH